MAVTWPAGDAGPQPEKTCGTGRKVRVDQVNETLVTVVGYVISPISQRQTGAGEPGATFRVASTERRYDKETQQWVDGDQLFVSVSCWRKLALGRPRCDHDYVCARESKRSCDCHILDHLQSGWRCRQSGFVRVELSLDFRHCQRRHIHRFDDNHVGKQIDW